MENIVNIAFGVLVIIAGLPMIINPKKVTEREKSKIKSEMGVRICGIVLVVLGVAAFFI